MNSTGNLEETEDMNAPVYEAMEEEEVHIPDHCVRCGHLEQLWKRTTRGTFL